MYGKVVLDITNYVTASDKTIPVTGYSADIPGWQWTKRTLPSLLAAHTRYNTYIGGHEYGLLDGTQLVDWQSGVCTGLEYSQLKYMSDNNYLMWSPQYTTGYISIYHNNIIIYSDYSFSENANWEIDGRLQLSLRDDIMNSSISVHMYKRLSDGQIVFAKVFNVVDAFTGIIVNNERINLNNGIPEDWSLVETRVNEVLINNNILYFNTNPSITIGADLDSYESTWENKGKGLASGRNLLLERFPIAQDVQLISVSKTGVITEWIQKPNLNFSFASDRHFSVNYDLGVIITGGYQAPNLILNNTIDIYDTEIEVILSDNIKSYPAQGIIKLNNEYIYYLERTNNKFLGCIRGYNDSSICSHSKGAIVEDIQHGMSCTDTWYVKYKAIPRVDYEVTNYNLRTANYNPWLNIQPLSNVKTNNIVQIINYEDNLAQIILSTDSELIGGNLYGPIYYGTDTSKLTAIGYDSAGNLIEDIDLSIYIKRGPGYLNGTLKTYTAESNTAGEINCFYNAPYNNEDISVTATSVTHEGLDTHIKIDREIKSSPTNIWIFQVLKYDPTLGTVGDFGWARESGIASEPNGLGYIDIDIVFTEDYNGGIILLEDSLGIRRLFNIRYAESRIDSSDEPFVRFYTDEVANPSLITSNCKAWLFQKEAECWDPVLQRGARVILYNWDEQAIHPITKQPGAYCPIHPDQIIGKTLIFSNKHLPIPDPSNIENNLGAYIIIAPDEVKFSAYGRDPFTGNLITSNDIRLKLQLPNTLSGIDTSGVLPIPYGWTLATEEFNICSGLDGANFITINPSASGINQFSMTGVI